MNGSHILLQATVNMNMFVELSEILPSVLACSSILRQRKVSGWGKKCLHLLSSACNHKAALVGLRVEWHGQVHCHPTPVSQDMIVFLELRLRLLISVECVERVSRQQALVAVASPSLLELL
eukprot:3012807-Amphidinium_carterae.1